MCVYSNYECVCNGHLFEHCVLELFIGRECSFFTTGPLSREGWEEEGSEHCKYCKAWIWGPGPEVGGAS